MEIAIKTEFITLEGLLKYAGVCQTGGTAKVLIQDGKVYLNGEICKIRKKKIVSGDEVKAKGIDYKIIKD